jgi:hypothetical protein
MGDGWTAMPAADTVPFWLWCAASFVVGVGLLVLVLLPAVVAAPEQPGARRVRVRLVAVSATAPERVVVDALLDEDLEGLGVAGSPWALVFDRSAISIPTLSRLRQLAADDGTLDLAVRSPASGGSSTADVRIDRRSVDVSSAVVVVGSRAR